MIILGSGSRAWRDESVILRTLRAWYEPDAELVVGDCPDGADPILRTLWAKYAGSPPNVHRAHWSSFDGAAGGERNQRMVDRVLAAATRKEDYIALFFVALDAGRKGSPGTMDCLARAERAGLSTVVHRWPSMP